jgi:hypothetical protein
VRVAPWCWGCAARGPASEAASNKAFRLRAPCCVLWPLYGTETRSGGTGTDGKETELDGYVPGRLAPARGAPRALANPDRR